MNKFFLVLVFFWVSTSICCAFSSDKSNAVIPEKLPLCDPHDTANFLNFSADSLVSKAIYTHRVQQTDSFFLCEDPAIISKRNQRKKKFIAAIFAFPFPFGCVGVHRVMLGTKPWVPIVYVASFGGCFGVLPLIDFCKIVFSKNVTEYENNDNVFMWLK